MIGQRPDRTKQTNRELIDHAENNFRTATALLEASKQFLGNQNTETYSASLVVESALDKLLDGMEGIAILHDELCPERENAAAEAAR